MKVDGWMEGRSYSITVREGEKVRTSETDTGKSIQSASIISQIL